jgi:hypothetical protein
MYAGIRFFSINARSIRAMEAPAIPGALIIELTNIRILAKGRQSKC